MKKFSLNFLWLITIIILAGALGAGGGRLKDYFFPDNDLQPKGEIHQSGYQYISPLLECADFHDIKKNELEEKLKNLINRKIKDQEITYASIYFRDLNNGPWIGINEQENFTPASLLKVPLMIAYLKIAETAPQTLQEEILIDNGEGKGLSQNIIPLKTVESGKKYKVADLLNYMIVYSDNRAANALLQHIDPDTLDKIYADLGMKAPGDGQDENFMSVRDYSSFFRILYNASYLNRDLSEKALQILTNSQFTQGLTAGVPDNIVVAHKFGERVLVEGKQLHDCGIIYKKNNPYLLCIMTRGNDFAKMSTAIKDFSGLVYTEFK